MAETLATKRANNDILLLISRLAIAALFIVAGAIKYSAIEPVAETIASVNLPSPMILAWAAMICEFIGGAMLIAGFMTRIAAVLFALFCLWTAYLFHLPESFDQSMTLMKNIALAGGCMALAGVGPGRFALNRG